MSRLAIDIGGTWLRYELIGGEEVCGKRATDTLSLDDFIVSMLEKHDDIDAIAISFAGQVFEGTILDAPNIDVKCHDLQDAIETRFGVRLLLENDLNCAALAESIYWGSGELVALYSGTGLGAGIVSQGELFRGATGLAGEVGHLPYKEAPFACGCGKHNCLELYASGSGLLKWKRWRHCDEMADLKGLMEMSGPCREIAEAYLEALVHAAATLITLCNPDILVLGGGVIDVNRWIEKEIDARIAAYAFAPSLKRVKIVSSRLPDASLEGAKILLDTI